MGGTIFGVILVVVGLSALVGIPLFSFLFAVILIAIGVSLILGRSPRDAWHWHRTDGAPMGAKSTSGEDSMDEVAIFSPLNKAFTGQSFAGGKIVMVFSGGEIDLSGVRPSGNEVHIEISSVFSSTVLVVPKGWKVRSSVAAIFGSATGSGETGEGGVTLFIHGEAVFGEIVVRN